MSATSSAPLNEIAIFSKCERANFRIAFDNFDCNKIAAYQEDKYEELLQNTGIIRHKLKIKAAISNAQLFIGIQKEFGSFSKYIWGFNESKTEPDSNSSLVENPTQTILSEIISKDLKKRGFKFVGPTIIYAYMQAIGMVNDHIKECFRYSEIERLKS